MRPPLLLASGCVIRSPTANLKLIGDAYPYYTADGGVECYVVQARAREDWLPNYYAPRLLYRLEKHSFYSLRIEQWGRDGKLAFIEVRLSTMFNPALAERGYGPLGGTVLCDRETVRNVFCLCHFFLKSQDKISATAIVLPFGSDSDSPLPNSRRWR